MGGDWMVWSKPVTEGGARGAMAPMGKNFCMEVRGGPLQKGVILGNLGGSAPTWRFASDGPGLEAWKISPLFRGLGWASWSTTTIISMYYNVLCAYMLYYLVQSMNSELPWANCANGNNTWASKYCLDLGKSTPPLLSSLTTPSHLPAPSLQTLPSTTPATALDTS